MANHTRGTRERGESKLGGLISLVVFVTFCYAIWNVAPVYIADYNLGDKMMEICRLNRGLNPDEKINDLLMNIVREQNLDDYIKKGDFKVNTRDQSRRISVAYERTVKILPGWVRTFKFDHDVDQPFF